MEIEGIDIAQDNIPQHIAIIMDGNGRWATKKGLTRSRGHLAGSKNIEKIVDTAIECGLKVLTIYAFSTENWKRTKKEIDYLMLLLKKYFKKDINNLISKGVKVKQIGDMNGFSKSIQKIIADTQVLSKDNDKILVNIALNYGARDEIKRAFIKIVDDIEERKISKEDISENLIYEYLDTKDIPEPELLIRTANEFRVSNFLLYQIAYSEIHISEKNWPDFNSTDFVMAIKDYQGRKRKFGSVS